MRIPNLDTSLSISLTIFLVCFFLNAVFRSKIISGIGGLFLLLGVGHFILLGAYAVYVMLWTRKK